MIFEPRDSQACDSNQAQTEKKRDAFRQEGV